MNLVLVQIFSLLCHGWGDYLLQSDWMAQQKTKSSWPALAHAFSYTMCFIPLLLLGATWKALLIIGGTHFVIDRFRLARYVCWLKNFLAPRATLKDPELGPMKAFKTAGLYEVGELVEFPTPEYANSKMFRVSWVNPAIQGQELVSFDPVVRWHHPWKECVGTGYHKERDAWMSVWLLIIADNVLHVTINALALYLL